MAVKAILSLKGGDDRHNPIARELFHENSN